MSNILKSDLDKLESFQELLQYKFNNLNLLRQALTTPSRGNELGTSNYEILETIGDAVLRLILSLKLFEEHYQEPGELTKSKQMLENDATLAEIASNYFALGEYIIKSEHQNIENTGILADILEALCGAVFLDSSRELKTVETIVINRFYHDWQDIVRNTRIFSKNKLLEHLQALFKFNPIIETVSEKKGTDHDPTWQVSNPRILSPEHHILIELPESLRSGLFKTKKEAEQDLYEKILKYLKKNS